MPYIYPGADKLAKHPLFESGTCVDLIKLNVIGLIGKPTTAWKQGVNVMEAFKAGRVIPRGTAIATFDKGHYPSRCPVGYTGSCHHAALLLNVLPSGIWIMDQYVHPNRMFVDIRFIRMPFRSEVFLSDGSYRNAGNNAMAFSVIEQ